MCMLTGIVILHEFGTNVVNIMKNGNGCLGQKDEEEIISGFLSAIMQFFNRSLGNILEIKTESYRLHLERYEKYMIIIIFEDFECFQKKHQGEGTALYPAFYHAYVFDTKWKIIKAFRRFIEKHGECIDPYKRDFEPLKSEYKKMLALSDDDSLYSQQIEMEIPVVENQIEDIDNQK